MAIIKIEINNRTLELSNVPSEFGNLSYYGLLRSVVRKMNELIDYENYDRTYIETFVDEVNKKITLLQEDYNSFKKTTDENYATFTTNINTSFQTFKQNMLESQDTFENDLLNKQTEFEKKITDDITLFTENLTTQFNEYKTSINNNFDSLSDEFKELKTYVTNYLESEEFKTQIGVEVTSYLNTPEFQNLMNQIISEQITSNNVVKKTDVASTTNLGLVKIGNTINFTDNKINVPFANTSNSGGIVKLSSNNSLEIDMMGNLNCKVATSSTKGVVKPDNNTININGLGEISVVKGSNTNLGILKPDSTTITADNNGIISAIIPESQKTFSYKFVDNLYLISANQELSTNISALYQIANLPVPTNVNDVKLIVIGVKINYVDDMDNMIYGYQCGFGGKLKSLNSGTTIPIDINFNVNKIMQNIIFSLSFNNTTELNNGATNYHQVEVLYQIL